MILTALTAQLPLTAAAAEPTPVGLWKSVDEDNGKPKALIRISESGGELRGKIEKLLHADGSEYQSACEKCEGALKDQPIVGMTILSGMKPDDGAYAGGQILDPGNGKTYRSKMTLVDSGRKLQVRGYIGTPLLGRTQTWVREP
ncbi:MAG: DUF2147 domain-containing protein [Herminiimonas sp.]|nr:DUF2147 domain-containing protein [Herminiimonas sp.]